MHLRALYFDSSGQQVFPKGTTEAVLPLHTVRPLKRTARDFLIVRPEGRLHPVISAVAHERARAKPMFHGMAAIACPARTADARAYEVVMAFSSPKGDIVHARWSAASLIAARKKLFLSIETIVRSDKTAASTY